MKFRKSKSYMTVRHLIIVKSFHCLSGRFFLNILDTHPTDIHVQDRFIHVITLQNIENIMAFVTLLKLKFNFELSPSSVTSV